MFLFRWPWRVARFFWALIPWQLVVIILPFTAFPFLTGVADGVLWYLEERVRYETSIDLYSLNVQRADSLSWWSVPGGPDFNDIPRGPYHITQIRDPRNWWEKLGLVRFDVGPEGPSSYAHLANLDVLYRRAPPVAAGKGKGEGEGEEEREEEGEGESREWHHWIFASAHSLHMENMFLDGWDAAFDQLLQHHNAHPAAHNASFSYISCSLHVLCYQWQVPGPALIHLTTDPAVLPSHRLDMSEVAKPEIRGYSPVAARIFYLPRTGSGELDRLRPLQAGTFPGHLDQMRSLTSRPDAWLAEPPQDPEILHRRGVERNRRDKMLAHPATFALLLANGLSITINEALNFQVLVDLGLGPLDWAGSATTVGFAAGTVGTFVGSVVLFLCQDAIKWLTGAAAAEDEDAAATASESGGEPAPGEEEPQLEANFMAQMLRSFLDLEAPGNDTADGISIEEMMKSSPEGSESLKRMWDIVHNGPPKDAEGGVEDSGGKGDGDGKGVDEDETGDLAFSVSM